MSDLYYIDDGYYVDGYFVYTADAIAQLNSQAATSTTPIRTREFEVSISAQFTQSTTSQRSRSVSSALVSEVTVQASAGKIVDASIDMDALFAPSVQANATRTTDVVLTTTSTLTASVHRTLGMEALLEFFASLDAQADRIRDVNSSAQSQATLDAAFIRQRDFDAAFNCESTLNLAFTQDFSAALTCQSSLTANAITWPQKVLPYGRPHVWYDNLDDQFTVEPEFTTSSAQGSHALRLLPNSSIRVDDPNFYFLKPANGRFTIEFWVKLNRSGSGDSNYRSLWSGYRQQVVWRDGSTPRIEYWQNNTQLQTEMFGTTYTIPNNTWTHIAVQVRQGRLSIRANNVQLFDTATTNFDPQPFNDRPWQDLRHSSTEGLISKDFDSFVIQIDSGGSTYLPVTGFTSQPLNTSATRINSRFNNSLKDFTGYTEQASANLNAIATQATSASYTTNASADITSTATLTAKGIVGSEVEIATTSELTATANVIREFDSTINANAALEATATRIKQGTASLEATFSQATTAQRVRTLNASIEAASELQANTIKLVGANSQLDTTSTLNATVGVIKQFNANLNTTASVEANATFYVEFNSSLTSDFSLGFNGGVLASASASLNSEFDVFAAVGSVVIDRIVYVIPREDRTATINQEDRTYDVVFEDRTWRVV